MYWGRHNVFICLVIFSILVPVGGYTADLTIGNTVTTTGDWILNGAMSATSFTGNGADLTNLNPANLSSGTATIDISGNAATATIANSVVVGGVTNSMLQHPSIMVSSGSGLTGGGSVALGGSVTLDIDFDGLGAANTAARSDHTHDDRYQRYNLKKVALLRWYDVNRSNCLYIADVRLLVFDGQSIWTPSAKINASSTVIEDISLSFGTISGMAFDGYALWLTHQTGNNILKYVTGGAIGCAGSVGAGGRGLVFDGSNIWVALEYENRVAKLRASDCSHLGYFDVGTNPYGVAFDGENIWVTNYGSNNVTKLRASDGALLGTYDVGTNPIGIAFDGENIWVTNYGSNSVTKLRASDGVILSTYDFTAEGSTMPVGIVFDGVNIWVGFTGPGCLQKL